MLPGVFGRFARATGLCISMLAGAATVGEAAPAAGTVITNTATLSYADAHGAAFTTQSNTLSIAVSAVSAVVVSPKEAAVDPTAEGYPTGATITRTFTVTNAGNAADAYTLTAASTGGGTIASISAVTSSGSLAMLPNATVTPTLQPGQSLQLVLTITTAGVAVGTAFPIAVSVRSTNAAAANGLVSDSGRVWALALSNASLAGPGGPTTAILKLVDHARMHAAQAGETVTYEIAFKNYGATPATNVTLVDTIPAGVRALAATTTLDGTNVGPATTLIGQILTVHIGTLAPGATGTVDFDAQLQPGQAAGATFVNVATLQADGISQMATAPASVFLGLADIVFDGYAGGAAGIGGAVLTLRDFTTKAILPLPAIGAGGSSFARAPLAALVGVPPGGLPPNTANANPYTTAPGGAYSFVFDQSQLGTALSPAVYELDIGAPGYRDRRIRLTITPDVTGTLYNVTQQLLDDQDLAVAGGFSLTRSMVAISNVFGLLGNFPMFAPHPLAVAKSVDRDVASGGDRLGYTLQVGASGGSFGSATVVDTLPAGVAYAPGTARVDNVPVEPLRNGRRLSWTLGSLAAQHTITYACVVLPFAAEGATLVNVVDVTAISTNGVTVGGSASADTRVVAGAFGNRIVLTGRVFVDVGRSGRFHEGDRGVAGVRVYLEDGESVTTDAAGRFTFPSVHPGQHVLRIDPTSLPPAVRAYDDHRYDSAKSATRLVHGLYDSGLMQDVNFALEPAS